MSVYFTRQGAEVSSGIIQDGKKVGFMEDRYCPRCGGRGYGPWFQDGGICYECYGHGGHHQVFVPLYTQEQLDKLNVWAEKARLKKQAQKEALAESIRQETYSVHGELLNRAEKFFDSSEFIQSVVDQAKRGKGISDRQVEYLERAIVREEEKLAKKAMKGEAPEGRVSVVGKVVSMKLVDSMYGQVFKMLVELDNFSTVWGSVPSKLHDLYQAAGVQPEGIWVSFEASFERAEDDSSHAFFKRPTKVALLSAVAC